MDDAELLRRFESADLTPELWTHRRHVRVAWLYLTGRPFEEAATAMRAGLKALLPKFGVVDSLTSGYHETITLAWMRLIAEAIRAYGPGGDSRAFLAEQTQFTQKRLLRQYYSRERLVSETAKREFVEPDQARMPAWPQVHTDGLRTADRGDLAALHALDKHSASGNFSQRVRRAVDAGHVMVVQQAAEVVAYAMLSYSFFDRAFVDVLVVRKDCRRAGHGQALMTALQALAHGDVYTSTNESNAPMHGLLNKLGYRQCGTIDPLDPGDPERLYILRR